MKEFQEEMKCSGSGPQEMPGKGKTAKIKALVLADDLTGALEAGAKFAALGIATQVAINESDEAVSISNELDVLVLDTETRHVPPDEAQSRVCRLAQKAISAGCSVIYKKTDSTLRGNIASELNGLLKACPGASVLYVPGYPKMGRTVKNGILYVDGQPVSATEFGADLLNPVGQNSIPRMLESRISARIITRDAMNLHFDAEEAVYVCDAGSEEEIQQLARLFTNSPALRLAAGPSGFLHHLAREMDLPRGRTEPLPQIKKALIVNGSRNSRSADQIRYAIERGFPIIDSAVADCKEGASRWWILASQAHVAEPPREAALRVANEVVRVISKSGFDGLIIFGGDTAYAVLRALGDSVVHPIGEVIEGVPISKIRLQQLPGFAPESKPEIALITKAGGFGPVDLLPMVRDALSREPRSEFR